MAPVYAEEQVQRKLIKESREGEAGVESRGSLECTPNVRHGRRDELQRAEVRNGRSACFHTGVSSFSSGTCRMARVYLREQ